MIYNSQQQNRRASGCSMAFSQNEPRHKASLMFCEVLTKRTTKISLKLVTVNTWWTFLKMEPNENYIVMSSLPYKQTSLNPVPNAQVCVYLTVHITKVQLQTTFSKPLYIWHSACIHRDPGRWKSWCLHYLWPVK
jgi:hypothetical protein